MFFESIAFVSITIVISNGVNASALNTLNSNV